jgi:hypothetical protein
MLYYTITGTIHKREREIMKIQVNQAGLKLNVISQLLVYPDDMTVLEDNMDATKTQKL